MKFVALISGGKDSFFNIHHSISRGHELVALGNLYPKQAGVDELDSFMFQTVGHDIIEYYGECLDVPLYRQEINGSSKNQRLEYIKTEEDEIEDLYVLLKTVKEKHPDVEGVSCGAILSHYQRTRVENVCGRLGLTCLAYLWQRNQLELMGEMCNNRLDARIIKVAAIGLNSTHLGKSIQQMYPYLIKLNQMYEVHICGEGGEFETIVLDAPFFKHKKLEIIEQEVVDHSNDDVSYLRLKVNLCDKVDASSNISLAQPPLLSEPFSAIFEELMEEMKDDEQCKEDNISGIKSQPDVYVVSTKDKLYISNLTSKKSTLEEQTIEIFKNLNDILVTYNSSFNDIQHVTLLLSDINQFNEVNKVYEEQFSKYYLPPSRICIETTLSLTTLVQLSCTVIHSKIKQGIHIRSRSYWAPQNIGPYSQAIVEENLQYKIATLSGQIPLEPSSMELLKDAKLSNRICSSVLSLQHLHRVKELIGVPEIGTIICFIVDSINLDIVSETWQKYIAEMATNDDARNLIIVKVKKLPKNACIEWGGCSFKNSIGMYEDEEDMKPQASEITNIVDLFESSNVVNINNGNIQLITLFTNDSNLVRNLVEVNKTLPHRLQIFTKLENVSNLGSNYEIIPVLQSWTYDKNPFSFTIIWTVEY
mmetsp:Transcript_5782/g.6947  ORF Transcript_5782/g.6947 Transcript_5782/m.6947 type:complete len:646 (-) Transcript_5782:2245-4182(-)